MKDEAITPLISIITPVYNCEDFVSETIESVIAQTYQNWELLIVDDCSTDSSFDIIKSYSVKDKRIIPLQNTQNSGQGHTRNHGLKNAKGNFIALLDSDDLWHPNKLEVHIKTCMEKNIGFSYSNFELINESGKKIAVMSPPKRLSYRLLLSYNPVGCLTIFYDKTKINNLLFEERRQFQSVEDNIFCAEIFSKFKNINHYRIPIVLASYRIRDNSSSAQKIGMFRKRINMLRNYFGLNYLKTSSLMLIYILRNLFKYSRVQIKKKLMGA